VRRSLPIIQRDETIQPALATSSEERPASHFSEVGREIGDGLCDVHARASESTVIPYSENMSVGRDS